MLVIACFDFWMSKGTYDIFSLVINFLDENWQPKKLTIGFFEAIETTIQTLVRNLRKLLDSYGLNKKIIVYVKDERANLNSMTRALKFVVNDEVLGLQESFDGICFGQEFSKTCQYAIVKERLCKSLKYVSIKSAQSNI
jgi:hypothetical protein